MNVFGHCGHCKRCFGSFSVSTVDPRARLRFRAVAADAVLVVRSDIVVGGVAVVVAVAVDVCVRVGVVVVVVATSTVDESGLSVVRGEGSLSPFKRSTPSKTAAIKAVGVPETAGAPTDARLKLVELSNDSRAIARPSTAAMIVVLV